MRTRRRGRRRLITSAVAAVISVVIVRRLIAVATFLVGFASQEFISDFRPSTRLLSFDFCVEVVDGGSLRLSAEENHAGR